MKFLPESVPVNPVRQTGVHIVVVAEGLVQSPAAEFAIGGREVQEVLVQVPVVDQAPVVQVARN